MTRRSHGRRAAIVLAAVANLLSGCGATEHATPSRRGSQVRDSTLERPLLPAEPPPPARAVRFAPAARPATAGDVEDARLRRLGRGSGIHHGIPVELAGFCQLAERPSDARAVRVDTLAMPRSPRRLVELAIEGVGDDGVRCIVRDAEQWTR